MAVAGLSGVKSFVFQRSLWTWMSHMRTEGRSAGWKRHRKYKEISRGSRTCAHQADVFSNCISADPKYQTQLLFIPVQIKRLNPKVNYMTICRHLLVNLLDVYEHLCVCKFYVYCTWLEWMILLILFYECFVYRVCTLYCQKFYDTCLYIPAGILMSKGHQKSLKHFKLMSIDMSSTHWRTSDHQNDDTISIII